MIEGMATCHEIQLIENQIKQEELQGDILDQKMFSYFDCEIQSLQVIEIDLPFKINQIVKLNLNNQNYNYWILKKFAFSAHLQRQTVVTGIMNQNSLKCHVFLKGSPEMVKSICKQNTIPSNYDQIVQQYASVYYNYLYNLFVHQEGFRIIALSTKEISLENEQQLQKLDREQIEKDLDLLGLIIFENKLKEKTKGVIQELNANTTIQSVMVTGDNPITAISIGRQCEIIKPGLEVYLSVWDEKQQIVQWKSVNSGNLMKIYDKNEFLNQNNYCFALTGPVFSNLIETSQFTENIKQFAVIYSRMNPRQKQQLIECFQAQGTNKPKIIAMCGDGANDCEAMIQSDVSLALATQEASLASSFTSNSINDISGITELIKEGRCALVTSFGAFKYMTLYSLIQFFSIVYLFYYGSDLMDYQYLYIDIWILGSLVYTMNMSPPSNQLTHTSPISKLVSFEVLSSVVGQIIIIVFFQLLMMKILQQQSWFVSNLDSISKEDLMENESVQCDENTIMFLFSSCQYAIISLCFYAGRPFRISFYKNYLFVLNFILVLIIHSIILFYPKNFMNAFLEIKHFNYHFRFTILIIAIVNSILSIIYSFQIQPFLYNRYKIWKKSREQ